MTLQNLKGLIDYAIDDCQWIILQNPKAVLSEGDFERLLSDCISKRIGYMAVHPNPNEYAVYSQISHYNNEENVLDARVDLLLMIPAKIENSLDHFKRFVYKSKESVAIELKYRHDDNKTDVDAAKEDIDKYVRYKDDSLYYTIILFDNKNGTANCEEEILKYYEDKKKEYGVNTESMFFCKILLKES